MTHDEAATRVLSGEISKLENLSLININLIIDSYTFRWMTYNFDGETNVKAKCKARLENIGLLSALVLTVWASFLFGATDIPLDRLVNKYSEGTANDVLGVYAVVMAFATVTMLLAVINSAWLLIMADDADEDAEVISFLRSLGLLATAPAFCFYTSVIWGTLGTFIWMFISFQIEYFALEIAVIIIPGFCVNALVYQFFIKQFYLSRLRRGHNLPSLSKVRMYFEKTMCPSPAKICVASNTGL